MSAWVGGPGHRSAGRGGQPRPCGRHPEQRGHSPGDRPGWSPSARQRDPAGRHPRDPQSRVRVPVGGDAGPVGGSGGSVGPGVRGPLGGHRGHGRTRPADHGGGDRQPDLGHVHCPGSPLQRGHPALGIRAGPGPAEPAGGRIAHPAGVRGKPDPAGGGRHPTQQRHLPQWAPAERPDRGPLCGIRRRGATRCRVGPIRKRCPGRGHPLPDAQPGLAGRSAGPGPMGLQFRGPQPTVPCGCRGRGPGPPLLHQRDTPAIRRPAHGPLEAPRRCGLGPGAVVGSHGSGRSNRP